jgi:hypothetical protein
MTSLDLKHNDNHVKNGHFHWLLSWLNFECQTTNCELTLWNTKTNIPTKREWHELHLIMIRDSIAKRKKEYRIKMDFVWNKRTQNPSGYGKSNQCRFPWFCTLFRNNSRWDVQPHFMMVASHALINGILIKFYWPSSFSAQKKVWKQTTFISNWCSIIFTYLWTTSSKKSDQRTMKKNYLQTVDVHLLHGETIVIPKDWLFFKVHCSWRSR